MSTTFFAIFYKKRIKIKFFASVDHSFPMGGKFHRLVVVCGEKSWIPSSVYMGFYRR